MIWIDWKMKRFVQVYIKHGPTICISILIRYSLSVHMGADTVNKNYYPRIYADANTDFKIRGCGY